MKAKVIGTGKWIDVCRKQRITMDVFVEYGTGKEWHYDEIALENEDKIGSYWFEKRNEYAGLAMQAILSNSNREVLGIFKTQADIEQKDIRQIVARSAVELADALIEELKRNKTIKKYG